MSNTLFNLPIPAVVAVVIRGEEVLLVRRGKSPNKGRWGFPGGKIEFGESIKVAAIRELKEETGIDGRADKILSTFDVFNYNSNDEIQQHFILIAVLCQWLGGDVKASSDAADARWFPIDELKESAPDLITDVIHFIKKAQQN